MASTYTPSLTLTQIGNGEQSGTWGTTTNTNWQLIEDAVAGVAQVSVSGTSGATLSVANGTTDQARKAVIVVTGSTSGTNAIVAPLEPKVYIISNQTTGGFNITIGASSGSVVTVPNGVTTLVYCDGTNFYSGITGFAGGNLSISGNITATGTITGATFATAGGVPQMAGGAANQIPYQTNANATSYIAAPANDTTRFLSYVPGTGFSWQTSSTTASSLNGGSANALVYQSSPGTTAFLANPGTSATYFLTYNNGLIWTTGGSVASVTATSPIGITGTSTNPNVTLNGLVPIANGGTGATSFAAAGLAQLSGATFTGSVSNSGGSFTSNNGGFASIGSGSVTLYNSNTGMFATSAGFGWNFNSTGVFGVSTTSVQAGADNTSDLGSSVVRWRNVYAANGSIITTSDANEKTEIANLDAAEKRVATRIKGLIKKFKFKDSVAEKGSDGARIHVGVIAQEVGDAFTAEGLDPHRYALFCYDQWEDKPAVTNEAGTVVQNAQVAGSRYGVRYEELLAFVIAAL